MTDIPPEAGALIAAGWASRKLFGPLIGTIGTGWADTYTDFRLRNLERVREATEAKLGDTVEAEGQIPPRVIARIMEDASWIEAPVMAEYFGGILAASRSADGVDDSGAYWAALLARMSTFDIYLHYVLYDALRRAMIDRDRSDWNPHNANLWDMDIRDKTLVHLTQVDILKAMGLSPSYANVTRVLVPSLNALWRESLVARSQYGDYDKMAPTYKGVGTLPSVVAGATPLGLTLWFVAHGVSDAYQRGRFSDPEMPFETVHGIRRAEGGILVKRRSRKKERKLKRSFEHGGHAVSDIQSDLGSDAEDISQARDHGTRR